MEKKVVALNSDFGTYRVADTYWKEKHQIQRNLNQYKKVKYHMSRNRWTKIIRLRLVGTSIIVCRIVQYTQTLIVVIVSVVVQRI